MESLQKLERVQRMLSFMQSKDLSFHDPDSDRFLAHLLVLLVQQCGLLSLKNKFFLLSELLEKITTEILEEAQFFVIDEDIYSAGGADYHDTCLELPFQSHINSKMDVEQPKIDNVPVIGFDAMQRANSTLGDFCRSYFIFHGMDTNKPQLIFKFLPVLSFTESYIYQLDAANENSLHIGVEDAISPKGSYCNSSLIKDWNADLNESSSSDPFDPLVNLLQHQGLLTGRIQSELKSGVEYWALERKLCQAVSTKQKISIEDVMRAIHLKSFDYRVLNLMLYHLQGQQVNELHMEFLSASEFLVEVSDDLFDYEDDVMNNTFNILRMFVAAYGASAAPIMLAKRISEAEDKYERLSKRLEPDLSLTYWKRCEEATKEGGLITGHAYGTWNIPPVIPDEELFRAQHAKIG